jgi:transcriptional repressor NrdR
VKCPFCQFESTRVVDSRITEPGDSIRRRRECANCGNRFTTYERVEVTPVTVIKRDGTRQRFDRQKLLRGLIRAANKRPVTDEQLEELAESIAVQVRSGGPKVKAEQIGELALRGLARVDPVTAIQFASVYRNFANLDELEEEIRRIKQEPFPASDQLALDSPRNAALMSDPESSIGRSPAATAGEQPKASNQRREHVGEP